MGALSLDDPPGAARARAKRALYYIYNIVTVLPRSASGPARSRIDWISRNVRFRNGEGPYRWVISIILRFLE